MGSFRESLLDRFPLRNYELDRLLLIFDACKPWVGDASLNLLLSTYLLGEEYTAVIASVEKDILPEMSQIIQQAYLDAVVIGISDIDQPEFYEKAQFLDACITLMGRGSERALAERFCKTFGDDCSPSRIADFVVRLAKAAYLLQYRSLPSQEINHNRLREMIAESLSNLSTNETEKSLSHTQFNGWLESQGKRTVKLLSTIFHFALLGETLVGTNLVKDSFASPREQQESDDLVQLSGFWKSPFDPIPFHLSLMGFGGRWFQKDHRLFNSDEDGLAFSSFANALVSFMGPTLVLIRTTENEVIGFYTELPWKNGPQWYTADDESASLLFRIHPTWTCYNMMPRSSKRSDSDHFSTKRCCVSSKLYHQLLSTPVTYRRGQGPLEGLAVEGCYAGDMDTTFEPGPLLWNERSVSGIFDVDALEVWAVRSESFCEDLAAGMLISSVRESTRLQIAQVDKRQVVEDFSTGMVISDLYRHRDQSWGRAEFNVDETN